MTDLAELFRQETGHTVTLTVETSGVLRQKLAAGEPADVTILNDYEMRVGGAVRVPERCAAQGYDYIDEVTTHTAMLRQHLVWNQPQSLFTRQGGLGHGLGLSLGIKLAIIDVIVA